MTFIQTMKIKVSMTNRVNELHQGDEEQNAITKKVTKHNRYIKNMFSMLSKGDKV